MEKYIYLLVGVVIGWVVKIPFLIKWYRELKQTRAYEEMRDKVRFKELEEKYNKMFPSKPLKTKQL